MKARGFVALMVLTIVLAATFACCPGETLPPGVTVEGIVEDAIAADAELDTCQFDLDMTMDIQMTMRGETFEATMTSDMSGAIDEPNEEMYMDMVIIMKMTGEPDTDMSTEMYVVDDWMYMNMTVPDEPTGWTKAPVEVGDWEEQDVASQQIDWLLDAEVQFLRSETVNGTECYVLEVRPDLEKLWALMQLAAGADEELPPEVDLSEIITDFSVEQWIAKDTYFIRKSTVEMTMAFSFEGFEMTYDIAATILIYDINEPVTIELPPEAADAVEVSETAHNADAESVQTAVLAYYATENGEWPITGATINIDGTDYDIIDMCELVEPSDGGLPYLTLVPHSCTAVAGDDNCDAGACACDPAAHYIWAIDTTTGTVYSACTLDAPNYVDGYREVYP